MSNNNNHSQSSALKPIRKCSFDSDEYKDLLEDSDEDLDSNSQVESNSVSDDEDSDFDDNDEQEDNEEDDGLQDIDDDELANLDMEPPRDIKQARRDSIDDDDLLMMCGNEDLMTQ